MPRTRLPIKRMRVTEWSDNGGQSEAVAANGVFFCKFFNWTERSWDFDQKAHLINSLCTLNLRQWKSPGFSENSLFPLQNCSTEWNQWSNFVGKIVTFHYFRFRVWLFKNLASKQKNIKWQKKGWSVPEKVCQYTKHWSSLQLVIQSYLFLITKYNDY